MDKTGEKAPLKYFMKKYRKMKTMNLMLLFIFFGSRIIAQPDIFEQTQLVNGFSKKIEGATISYHSSIPLAKESLLVRATDGNSSMEWETSPAPINPEKKNVTFVWLSGLGSSPGTASFSLQVNDSKKFEFWADGTDEWQLRNEEGWQLTFRKDYIDQHGDRFGFMYLTIPASEIETGKPLKIKITGGNYDKTSWYMTFMFEVKTGFSFKSFPAITRKNGSSKQLAVAGVLHFGEATQAKIFIDNKLLKQQTVNFGYNYIKIELPEVEKSKTVNYKLEIGDFIESGEIKLNPVKKWRVNFVQHAHTDIGYTRPQTEILAEHLRYIDYALDFCDNTDDYPDAAKFRWTCEATWPVDEYLKSRPESQIQRFKQRVKEGRIELSGMYFNFDELPDEQILAASLQPLKTFRENGLEVKVAMQNDVNGIAWCMIDYFNDLGIKYLNMGTHGHRALICFDKPTLFWWESLSGKKMLAYRAEHYMTGNTVFKIHTGDFNVFEDELLTYLIELENKEYKYDLISIQHSGYLTDNAPPSTLACEMIKQWNEKYEWPRLKTASATAFFEEMESKYGNEFETIRGAWPDWWTDGFGASAREVATIREAKNDLISNTAGLAMAAILGSELPANTNEKIEETNNALLFYTEHTVGYHGSVREPFSKNTMTQRALKESYAWEASRRAKMIGETALGFLQSHVLREKEPSLLVFNTLSWNRGGLLKVYIDHQILPRDSAFSITDKNGNAAWAQPIEHFSDGTSWAIWVNDIPAFGYKKFNIEVKPTVKKVNQHNFKNKTVLENEWYKLVMGNENAVITGLFDKELNQELVDGNAKYKLGEFIYEMLDNRSQMEAFKLDNYTREPLQKVWFDEYTEGPVWNSVRFKGNTPAAISAGDYVFEIRLFNTIKRIDLFYAIEKKSVTEPEGIYIAFPFKLDNGVLSFDVAGGEIRAGIDQIKGSANDWNTVQNYARLSNSNSQIVLSSLEIPLMQFGGINTGRYQAGAVPESTHIFAWPMNNYWVTNFNAEQRGGHSWIFTITSSAGNSQIKANQTGVGNNMPFLSRVLPGGGEGDDFWEKSVLQGWPENVALNYIYPKGKNSVIIHVKEVGGIKCNLSLTNFNGKPIQLIPVNLLGEELQTKSSTIHPFENRFFSFDIN